MSLLQGIILGIVQGLTEFLPVSSSGHLILLQNIFKMSNLEQYVFFDLILHLGTVLAILVVFRKSIKSIIVSRRIFIFYVVIGVVALLPFHFAIEFLKSMYDVPQYLGLFFIVTALVLALGELTARRAMGSCKNIIPKAFQCAVISMSQILAILPGVSRSGMTISTARILGWRNDEAAEYSFILSVPVILMGVLYEGLKILNGSCEVKSISIPVCIGGLVASFVVGVFALTVVIKLLRAGKFRYFAVYCFILGIFCLAYFNLIKF